MHRPTVINLIFGIILAILVMICTCVVGGCGSVQKSYLETCDVVARADDNYALLLEALRLNGLADEEEIRKVAVETGELIVRAHNICYEEIE